MTRDSWHQKSSFFSCSDSEDDDKQEMILFATKIDSIVMRKKAKIQKRIEIGKEMNNVIKRIKERGTINIKYEEEIQD